MHLCARPWLIMLRVSPIMLFSIPSFFAYYALKLAYYSPIIPGNKIHYTYIHVHKTDMSVGSHSVSIVILKHDRELYIIFKRRFLLRPKRISK